MRKTAKRKKKVNLRQTAFTRFMLVIAVFVLWIGGISARLVHLQVKEADWLRERADIQRHNKTSIRQLRGTILDRNGRTLAMSEYVNTLFADATELTDIKATSKILAKALNLNEAKLANQLNEAKEDERKFVPIAKALDRGLQNGARVGAA